MNSHTSKQTGFTAKKFMYMNSILNLAVAIFTISMTLPVAAALYNPHGLAVDPNTKVLYIADSTLGGRVAKFNPQQKTLTTFVTADDPFSVAVNSNGMVYVGIVGQNQRIEVYDSNATSVKTFSVPSGSSPLNLTIDANNDVFMTKGFTADQPEYAQVYLYNSDFSLDFAATGLTPYTKLQTNTIIYPNTRYSLVTDNGYMYFIDERAGNVNKLELSTFVSGHAVDVWSSIPSDTLIKYYLAHQVYSSQSFSSIADNSHNIIYTDPDNLAIKTVSGQFPSKILLDNLPSSPFGIAYDSSRSLIYVAFPGEQLVRGYIVNYTTQNGVKTPTSLTKMITIQ